MYNIPDNRCILCTIYFILSVLPNSAVLAENNREADFAFDRESVNFEQGKNMKLTLILTIYHNTTKSMLEFLVSLTPYVEERVAK